QFAGGNFIGNSIAKWDGINWSPVGIGLGGPANPLPPWATTLKALDDGTGSALYVAGDFNIAGGAFANRIAKWNGLSWSAMGAGLVGVNDFLVFDDGTGPAIHVTGVFRSFVGDPFTDGIAKWTGSQWVQLGSGLVNTNGTVSSRAVVFDDGTGSAIYAYGNFDIAGGLSIGSDEVAKWDGQNWSTVTLQQGAAQPALVYDDGTGSALYFSRGAIQAPSQFVKWDGQTWTDAFVSSEPFDGAGSSVYKTLVGEMDDGNGPTMFATTWSPIDLLRWNGQDWVSVRPFGCGGTGFIQAVAQFDDAFGSGIYMVGKWITVAGQFSRNVAMLRGCTVPLPGDCDTDGDVDMTDFEFLAGCLSGPEVGSQTGCECSDVDGDGDVDLGDFQAFMASFTG
ncbi:MAG: hypothetical protein GXP29_03825, partial [Planctomycetes bacterium]|nr:hypothetical protein [Planctomycetota bacterium]